MIPARRPPVNKRTIFLIAALAVILFLIASTRFYTDVLWFNEVGLSSVLWKSLRTQFGTGLVVGLITGLVVLLNLWIAGRSAPTYVRPSIEGRPDPFDRYRQMLRPFVGWIRVAIAFFVGISSGVAASTSWQEFLLWANRTSFGKTDPQFGKDIGFYVFELPFITTVVDWFWFAIMASLFVSLAAHYFHGSIRPEVGLRGVLPGALAHISVLLGLLAVIKAVQYWLGTFQLNFSERGTVVGASYTDVNAQLPALRLLAIISIISALLFLVNIYFRRLSLPLAAVAIWVLTAFLAGSVWPFVVQRFSVEPQEPQRERPYIERNLTATRDAFGLSNVGAVNYAAGSDLVGDELEANESTIQNVRLWDPAVLQKAYEQLQAIRTYYRFEDVDVDRYEIAGETRQVLLSARELSIQDIPERSQTWQNVHLQYTHGFGLVASLANASTVAGQPSFLIREVPGTATAGAEALMPEQPRLYYGESFAPNEYAIVASGQSELDYPLEDGGVERSNYEGEGGVGIGGYLRRIAFAIRERDPNLVLSSLVRSESKILIYRNVRDRVSRAAPFLALDSDPYPVVDEGRIKWILDAYTTTRYYPYSERFDAGATVANNTVGDRLDGRVNYVRNSVKVVVDAYDGSMDFYIIDEEDPLIQTWQNAFPDLFSTEEPSESLQAHFRYPEDLFRLQTEVYRTYHMTEALDFYSKEDEWNIPDKPTIAGASNAEGEQGPVSPIYLLFRPPGESEERFVLTRPFVPRNRPNMISMLVASSDPGSYGELTSLMFPRSRSVLGPQQVDNLINQDVDIARTLSLLRQRGSDVTFGSLVILPIEDSILNVQPIFVTASSSGAGDLAGIPELKFVAMVMGEEVVMETTFEEALAALFDLEPSEPTEPTEPGEPGEEPEEPPLGDIATLIEEAGDLYEQAQAALTAGDFAEYGRLIEQLGRVLSELGEASGTSPGGSSSGNNGNND